MSAAASSDGTQVNSGPMNGGGRYVDAIDPEDPNRVKELMKPAEVKEDMKQMEARARVSQILNSQAFRDELEEIIESQMKTGVHPASLIALQQISQLILPHTSPASSGLQGAIGGGRAPIIPVADIKGGNSTLYTKGEKLLRCKLACLYRLVDLFGWTYIIYNHITVRIGQNQEHFLINPFGLMYSEVTAGSLVKIDMQGNVIDQGNTNLGINMAGFTLHSAIHAARPDIRCIIHVHTSAAVAVSVMKCGLLPICREALFVGEVKYHEYKGIFINEAEREELARDLGPSSKVLFLRNHGLVACGSTIEEALYYFYNTMLACEAQVRVASVGLENIVLMSEAAKLAPTGTTEASPAAVNDPASHTDAQAAAAPGARKWRKGELEFEAWMRLLDNAGYRTGYIYRQPILRTDRRDKLTSDVEYPASTSALQYYDEADKGDGSALKEAQKKQQKAEWLNTPNVYRKEEMDEIGTPNPKKYTKWVPDADSRQAAPIKVLNANQFAPQGANPNEFRQAQKQIKEVYYKDKVTAGPQSKILEGATWDDSKIADAGRSMTGDAVIVVGAASKGIIKKDHQHNAVVFRQQYGANPFGAMTDDELTQYKKEVERKQLQSSVSSEPPALSPAAAASEEEEEFTPATPVMESSITDAEPDADAVARSHDSDVEDVEQVLSPGAMSPPTMPAAAGKDACVDDDLVFSPAPLLSPTDTSTPVATQPTHYLPQFRKPVPKPRPSPAWASRSQSKETSVDDDVMTSKPSAALSLSLLQRQPDVPIHTGEALHMQASLPTAATAEAAPASDSFRRTASERYPEKSPALVDELKSRTSFERSKSERKPKGVKSAGSADALAAGPESRSTEALSGAESAGETAGGGVQDSPSKGKDDDEKKKKKKFRMPSFSSKKKEEKKDKKAKQQTAV